MKWYEKLKFARKVKGMSLKELSYATGISTGYLNNIENGKITNPSFFKIIKLLELYNLGREDLEDD